MIQVGRIPGGYHVAEESIENRATHEDSSASSKLVTVKSPALDPPVPTCWIIPIRNAGCIEIAACTEKLKEETAASELRIFKSCTGTVALWMQNLTLE